VCFLVHNESLHLSIFMTGTSSGFGRRLTGVALARGDRVIATARTLSKIEHFPQHPNLHLMQLDVNASTREIKARIDRAARVWNGIDVLVNNAGYGLFSLLEEGGYAHQPTRALRTVHG
jgi:NADP-dependent 3-hydroxy acid dehydrogenase YdfG